MNRQKRKGARTHSSPDHSCVRASRAPRLTFSRQKSGGVLQEFLWKKIRANDIITSPIETFSVSAWRSDFADTKIATSISFPPMAEAVKSHNSPQWI